MLPAYWYLGELGIPKDHPTKLEAEAVWMHIDETGDGNSMALQIGSRHAPSQPEALIRLLTNYFESCLRMRNLSP